MKFRKRSKEIGNLIGSHCYAFCDWVESHFEPPGQKARLLFMRDKEGNISQQSLWNNSNQTLSLNWKWNNSENSLLSWLSSSLSIKWQEKVCSKIAIFRTIISFWKYELGKSDRYLFEANLTYELHCSHIIRNHLL